MIKLISIMILICLLLASCTIRSDSVSQPNSPLANGAERETHARCEQTTSTPVAITKSGNLTTGINTLALGLYQAISQKNHENLIYSPYSAALAFSMAYAGAKAQTEAQMAQYLHFLPQATQHAELHALDCYLNNLAKSVPLLNGDNKDANTPFQLQIANSAWGQTNFPFKSSYTDTVERNYSAALEAVDFTGNPDQAIAEINQWVAKQTAGKIEQLLTKSEVTPLTRLALVNATYFKASWLNPFPEAQTQPAPFHLLAGATVNVPLMHSSGMRTPYLKGSNYQAVRLPYVGDRVEMLIIVPDENKFAEVEQQVSLDMLADINTRAELRDVDLAMPKFDFETKSDLVETLQALGMQVPFDPTQADFSGMLESGKGLYISAAIQQATIAIDEKGTEAAAATGVLMANSALERAELTVDRPFIYVIRENKTNLILFMGRVLNPAA